MKDNDERKREFLIGLRELTHETGIEVVGCGCCGSPRLEEATITSDEAGYICKSEFCKIKWIDPSDNDFWDENYNNIIK